MRVALLAPLAGLLLVSGCLPDRDNVNDPVNRPNSGLVAAISSGGRFTVFELDARGTCEGGTCGGGYRFAWELHDPDLQDPNVPASEYFDYDDCDLLDEADPNDPARLECEAGNAAVLRVVLPLSRESVCPGVPLTENCVGSVERTVRVRVRGPKKGFDESEVTVRQTNTAPVADLGSNLFVSARYDKPLILDACGGVTRTGAVGPVEGCTSVDADPDDVLTATFTATVGTAATIDALRASLTYTPGIQAQILVEGVVSDGWATSLSRTRVFFGPHAWVGTSGPASVYELFPDSQSSQSFLDDLDADVPFRGVTALGFASFQTWVGGTLTGGDGPTGASYVVALDRFFSNKNAPRWQIDGESFRAFPSLVPASAGGVAAPGCAVYNAPGEDPAFSGVLRLVDAPVPAADDPCDPAHQPCVRWLPPGPAEKAVAVFPEAGGTDCMILTKTTLRSMDVDGVVGAALGTLPNGADVERAFLDQDGETIWAIDYSLDVPFTPAVQDSSIYRIHQDGTFDGPLVMSAETILSLTPHPDGGMLAISRTSDELFHLDEDLVTIGMIALPVPGLDLFGGTIASDPATRTIWIGSNVEGALYAFVLTPGGELLVENERGIENVLDGVGAHSFTSLIPDAFTGGILAQTQATDVTQLDFLPPHLQRVREVEAARGTSGSVRGSQRDGSLWLETDPILHYSPDGGKLGEFSNPGVKQVAIDDLGRAWASTTSSGESFLRVIDPFDGEVERIPVAGPVQKIAAAGDLVCGVVVEPGQPLELFRVDASAAQGPFTLETLDAGLVDEVIVGVAAIAASDVTPAVERCGFLVARPDSPGDKSFALFADGVTTSSLVPIPLTEDDNVQGFAIDPRSDSVWVANWYLPNYGLSSLLEFDMTGAEVTEIVPFVAGETVPAIPLGVAVRQGLCSEGFNVYACVEVWTNLRYSMARGFFVSPASGTTLLETVRLPAGETARLDLVP